MSVDVCKAVMRAARLALAPSGVDPDDPALGIPLKGVVYRAMNDVQADGGYSGLSVGDKAALATEIVSGFFREVTATRRRAPCAGVADVAVAGGFPGAGDAAGADSSGADGGAEIGSTPVSLLRARYRFDAACDPPARDVGIGDPFADYSRTMECAGGLWEYGRRLRQLNDSDAHVRGNTSEVIPRAVKKRLVKRYLLLNGYDRDYVVFPNRYSWTANISSADSAFVGVRSLAATCLIVPREVYDELINHNFVFVPKTNYMYAHGLPFPYLILNLAEFQNVYKSTNTASSKAFAHFVFHSYFSSPNGRDYIRMEPVQDERLTFDINPLAQLSHLTISVQQPSGALLNGSRDDMKIKRIRYADANAAFLRDKRRLLVELSHHFDKNEFFKNDTVRFSGFRIPRPEANEVNEFVTRPEGHRIVDMLVGNSADDMVDGFYVQIMGDHNVVTGDFDIDANAVAVLAGFNDALDLYVAGGPRVPYFDYVSAELDASGLPVVRNHIEDNTVVPGDLGRVINASLQCTVSFRLEIEEDDVSASGANPISGDGSFSTAAGASA